MELIDNQIEFFKKYNILKHEFEYNEGLVWEDLKIIYYDFKKFIEEVSLLDEAGHQAVLLAKRCNKIHSIRYRIKEPEHLIAKIIREKVKNKNNAPITIDNYKTKVEDIIGIRLLHVFKDDWKSIHKLLVTLPNSVGKPFAYFRDGDDEEFIRELKEEDISLRNDDDGYRSIHYKRTIRENITCHVSCEIQVRTLFEEAWSEISHATRYPNNQENHFLKNYFKIFNRLSGALDEMGIFIRDANNIEQLNESSVIEKNEIIDKIEDNLSTLISDGEKFEEVKNNIEKLRLFYPEKKTAPTLILNDRKEFFEQAIKSLKSSAGHYRSVIEGPFFLHPDWVIELRNRFYESKGQPMPNYDIEVNRFINDNIDNEQADIRFIIRNSKRYIAKLEEIRIPVADRDRFKRDMVNNIHNLSLNNSQNRVKLLCLNTGFISVSEIYQNSALESDKKDEDNPLTKGFYHESTPFVEVRQSLFDSIFNEHFDNNNEQIKGLISFINSLWEK